MVDLKKGLVNILCETNGNPTGESFWDAVYDAGFTPNGVKLGKSRQPKQD